MENLILFFDDCHKIYYAERTDQPTIDQMKEYGYDIIDGGFKANLAELWAKSCPLRMIDPANMNFDLPSVEQGHSGPSILKPFMAKLNKQFKEV